MALRLRGATSGYIELKAPASAGDNTLTLPTNNGSANQLLKTDGSGNLSWTDDNSGVSLSGSTNNTIATVTGANALIGEANLTFNGSGDLTVKGNDGISANLYLIADRGDDNGDGWRIGSNQDTNDLTVANNTTGSYVDKITLLKTGEVGISVNPSSGQMLAITGRSGYDDIVQVTAVGTNMGARINLTNTGTGVARLNATNNSLELQTSGSPRLRILSDGKVGIGTTSPDRTLNITSVTGGNCDVEVKAANNTGWCQLLFSDTDAAFRGGIGYEHQNNYMAFYTGAQEERLRIDSTGAVGLGITTPKDNDGNYRQLQIGLGAHFYGRTDDTPIYLSSNAYYDGSNWKYTANTTVSQIAMGTNITFKNAPSGTAGNTVSLTERLRITSAGKVGVNESSPDHMFHIKGTSADNNPVLAVESNTWAIGKSAALRLAYTDGNAREIRGHYDHGLQFFLNNGESMRIDTAGHITSPTHCCFEVKLMSSQSFTSGSRFKINFTRVENQQGTSFDTSNNRFTAPVAGYYQFNVGVYSYYSTFMELDGRCNGASTGVKTYRPTTRNDNGADGNPGASIMASWIVKLAKDDYYEIFCQCNSSHGTRYLYADINRTPTWWSGFLIC